MTNVLKFPTSQIPRAQTLNAIPALELAEQYFALIELWCIDGTFPGHRLMVKLFARRSGKKISAALRELRTQQ
jgi:hypothetical protein